MADQANAVEQHTSPVDRVVSALATFGTDGAKATEWEKRSSEKGGPKSGQFYNAKEQAIKAGRVIERDGRFYATGELVTLAPELALRSAASQAMPQLTPPSSH